MKLHTKVLASVAATIACLISCSDDVTSIGVDIMPVQDSLSTFTESYPLATKSVTTGRVVANASNCFLGQFMDPETHSTTTCSFLAQFHLQEDYTLPELSRLIKDEDGNVAADSCVIRIFHDKFYGDSLTTMKLTATDLRMDKVMEEGQTYYTDIDPKEYVNPTPRVKATTTYSVLDQNQSSSATNLSSGNYRTISVHLGKDYGTDILRKYYEHPEYFKNSYTFSHNVCPGFYIEHTGGIGTIINSDVSVLDVYFRYQENDTTVTKAWMRLGATQEVIQNTSFNHSNISKLFDEDGYAYDNTGKPLTYIKSPAGIHTEIELDIDKIIAGDHYNDTINSARFTLRRHVPEVQQQTALSPPSHLLLIRKGEVENFFTKSNLPDSETTFLGDYSATNNAYTFSNIAPLITFLRKQRDNEAGVTPQDSEEVRKQKWANWEKNHPDWQTLELIPVAADYSVSSSAYYGTTKTLVGIHNDYNLHSVKLEGCQIKDNGNGEAEVNGDVKLNVIYSRFKK